MRRTLLAITVLAALGTVAVLATRQTPIATEPLVVAVPAGPGEPQTIDLDALLYLPVTTPAPAVLLAHGFGSDRTALDGVARQYAAEGYVVLAWSARGFGLSDGTVGLNDPDREVADVTELIDLLADRDEVVLDGPGDPRVGIAGGSYGGGLALLAAAQEPRLDAVVAAAAWHSLAESLSPNRADARPGVLKEQWAAVLFASTAAGSGRVPEMPADEDFTMGPVAACGRFELAICVGYARTAVSGMLQAGAAALLDRSSLAGRLEDISAPTMLISGQDDTLFGLDQAASNAAGITAPLAVRWVAGDHGAASRIDRDEVLAWLDVHLRDAARDLPAFSWTDTVSGSPQPGEDLPRAAGEDPAGDLSLTLTGLGRLVGDPGDQRLNADAAGNPRADGPSRLTVARPPGGVPAALSTLPGLGDLGTLLPSIDLPGQSAVFTTDPLAVDVTLLGSPTLTIDVSAVPGDAVLFIKLHDVSPGGQARLLQSAVNPTRLTDLPTTATLALDPLAHRLVAGNRLRLTIATTDQAHAVGREPSLVTLDTRDASLVLPTAEGALVSPLPAAVRITLPLIVVTVLALLALALITRHERRLSEQPADADADPVVIRGLVKRYADGKVAVDGLDLTVGRGQVFGLLGPNGAGKTTTMRMLLGLIHPTEGSIRLLGRPLSPGHPVLQRVGVLVEGPGFAPYLTGLQNLQSTWAAGGRPWTEANAERALAVADLGADIHRPTRTYSHGMRQRLAIAQALLGDPELLVLDEPTDGLDPEQIRAMRQLLSRLGEEGLTILVSSHLLAEVEQMCTHAAVVSNGRVVAAGPVAELVGGTRTMVIQTADRERARAVLADLLGAGDVDVEGTGLVVRLGDTPPGQLITALVTAGVTVTAATPRGRLEDTFLALTGGEG